MTVDSDYLERLAKSWKGHGHRVAFETAVAGETCSWVEYVAGFLVNKLGFVRCTTAPQFYWSSERMVALELHMVDIHGAATPSGREKFVKDLTLESISRERSQL